MARPRSEKCFRPWCGVDGKFCIDCAPLQDSRERTTVGRSDAPSGLASDDRGAEREGYQPEAGTAHPLPAQAERLKVAVRSDIHHLIQPVIGHMRMFTEGRWEAPTREQMTGWVERLYVALEIVDALGDDEARAALASKCGLGYATTPEAEARNIAELRRILGGTVADA